MIDSKVEYIEVTVSAAADGLSNAVDLGQKQIVGIKAPSSWTAAALGFVMANDKPLVQDGAPTGYSLVRRSSDSAIEGLTSAQMAVAGWWGIDILGRTALMRRIKLFSHDGSGTAEQQGAARTVVLAVRELG